MDPHALNRHLSHITTLWTLVRRAHAAPGDEVGEAQRALLERYGGAAHRYLLGALRDPDGADELFQEFCLRFLRGGFRNADPGRGRFRDFVKTALFHLVVDYRRRRRREAGQPLVPDVNGPVVHPEETTEAERAFLASWREELMGRTWLALEGLERDTCQPHHTVLRCRADHPLLSSADLAAELGARLGKRFSVDGVRQALHRAREKFTDLLLDEVRQSLEGRGPEALEAELADLGLLAYCRPALERWRGRTG